MKTKTCDHLWKWYPDRPDIEKCQRCGTEKLLDDVKPKTPEGILWKYKYYDEEKYAQVSYENILKAMGEYKEIIIRQSLVSFSIFLLGNDYLKTEPLTPPQLVEKYLHEKFMKEYNLGEQDMINDNKPTDL